MQWILSLRCLWLRFWYARSTLLIRGWFCSTTKSSFGMPPRWRTSASCSSRKLRQQIWRPWAKRDCPACWMSSPSKPSWESFQLCPTTNKVVLGIYTIVTAKTKSYSEARIIRVKAWGRLWSEGRVRRPGSSTCCFPRRTNLKGSFSFLGHSQPCSSGPTS